jgi:hypothetical protein
MVGRRDLNPRIGGDRRAGLRDGPVIYHHVSGHDEGAGALAGSDKPAIDQRDVQADLSNGHDD